MNTFIVGFIFGIIALVIAQGKGRSPLWFFAGFFFSFFGIIVILFMPAVPRRQAAGPQAQAGYARPAQPESRPDDYVPPIMKKDDYKSNSVDVGFEVIEDEQIRHGMD